jgi:hypothetical protein
MAAITKLAHSVELHTNMTGERCDGLIGCWQLMPAKGKLLMSLSLALSHAGPCCGDERRWADS